MKFSIFLKRQIQELDYAFFTMGGQHLCTAILFQISGGDASKFVHIIRLLPLLQMYN